jgi:hypothetical protein
MWRSVTVWMFLDFSEGSHCLQLYGSSIRWNWTHYIAVIRHESLAQWQNPTSEMTLIPRYCNLHFTGTISEVSRSLLFRVNIYNQYGRIWRHFLYDISYLLGVDSLLRNKDVLKKKSRNISAFYGYRRFTAVRINVGLANHCHCILQCAIKGKHKGHPCTGTEAQYRPYGP